MLSPGRLDRIHVVSGDHRLVDNAGLLLPAILTRHLGMGEMLDHHVDSRDEPGSGECRRQAADPSGLGIDR